MRKRLKILLLCLTAIVFIFTTCKIIGIKVDEYQNKTTYNSLYELYDPFPLTAISDESEVEIEAFESEYMPITLKDQPEIQVKFNKLLEMNADTIGWITVEGTHINYPITQTDDNDFYLNRDFNNKENIAGSIFMDFRNQIKNTNRNIILYGHSMKNGTMFGDILKYESKWNFENHNIIQFDTLYENYTWEIFSAYVSDKDFYYIQTDFDSDEEYKTFLQTIKEKSFHPSDMEVSEEDKILTLSTCSYASNNARFVVHAKLIESS
jgi:sortase B